MKIPPTPLCLFLAAVGCKAFVKPDPVVDSTSAAPPLQSAHASEHEWIGDAVVRDLAEMTAFAKTQANPPPAALRVSVKQALSPNRERASLTAEVTVGSPPAKITEAIALNEHLWSPADYEAVARRLLDAQQLTPAPSADPRDESLLRSLLEPRPATLLAQNVLVSRRLADGLLDPAAHESAALLLGAFAMREAAGCFSDTRLTMARMTAHLALARAFRRGPAESLDGAYAEAVLSTLVGRQADALAALDRLAAGAEASLVQKSWIKALRFRNTRDWRLAEDAPRPSLLERLERYRALSASVPSSLAMKKANIFGEEPLADWSRITMERSFSVQAGNVFMSYGLNMEMQEAAEAWAALHPGQQMSPNGWVAALEEPPTRCLARDKDGRASPQVLSWGTWAAFGQRHLCEHITRSDYYLRDIVYLKEQAKSFGEQMDQTFSALALYPIVAKNRTTYPDKEDADPKAYQKAMASAMAFAARSPEKMTAAHWLDLREKPEFAAVPAGMPNETAWFTPGIPTGTVYDPDYRVSSHPYGYRGPMPAAAELEKLAPYNLGVVKAAMGNAKLGPDELAARFGALAEYSTGALDQITYAAIPDVDRYRRYMGRLCDLAPLDCFAYGFYLAEHGLDDEAAAAYRKGAANAGGEDAVFVANSLGWLVDYEFAHGRRSEAMRLANVAAETYSARGLLTRARLAERMGRFDEAESYCKKVAERYDENHPLTSFYYRRARGAGDARYESRLQPLLKEVFPAGLAKLDASALAGRPRDGVVLRNNRALKIPPPVSPGDIVVAVNGWRVQNDDQYEVAMAFDLSPDKIYYLWKRSENTYAEVPVRTIGRGPGVASVSAP